MNNTDILIAKLLAEVLRLQRWAGGESVSADRIHGLENGFESAIKREIEEFGVSHEIQEKVEDILEDVESKKQSTTGPAIKDRLWRDKIDESVALRVMERCKFQSRFTEGIQMIASGQGSVFPGLLDARLPEQNWFGALHYMELVDCTEEVEKPMHAVFAPAVPRIGELVRPQIGPLMQVVEVEHVVIDQGNSEGAKISSLVPHVYLEAFEDDGEDEVGFDEPNEANAD